MTLMPIFSDRATSDRLSPDRAGALAAAAEPGRESRAVDVKRLPPGFAASLTLPEPAAHAALTAATGRAALRAEDIRHAPTQPRALTGAAIEQRFRYWYGRSGRRYLFSEMDQAEIAGLDGAVILIEGDTRRPDHIGLDLPADRDLGCGRVFVHLLAETDTARAAVIADLTPRAL